MKLAEVQNSIGAKATEPAYYHVRVTFRGGETKNVRHLAEGDEDAKSLAFAMLPGVDQERVVNLEITSKDPHVL